MGTTFAALGRAGQTRRLRTLAERALAAYPIRPVTVRRMAEGWNVTFAVTDDAGRRWALRVHRPDGPDAGEIESELQWLAALSAETDLVVPRPVATTVGAWSVTVAAPGVPEARTCDLLAWVDGRFRNASLRPADVRAAGELMGRLQEHGRTWTQPAGWRRPPPHRVDTCPADDPMGPAGVAAAVVALQAVRADLDGGLVRSVADAARQVCTGPDADAGTPALLHADLHQWNYLFPAAGGSTGLPAAIDFDDCGVAPPAYDVAVARLEFSNHDDPEPLEAALLEGYARVRPVSDAFAAAVGALEAWRLLQLMVYAATHRDDPQFRDSVAGDLGEQAEYLAELAPA